MFTPENLDLRYYLSDSELRWTVACPFSTAFAASVRATTDGDCNIRRPMRAAPEREPAGPRMNEDIRVREVRLIDHTGTNVGVVATTDALAKAVEAGLDLVEISPDANPGRTARHGSWSAIAWAEGSPYSCWRSGRSLSATSSFLRPTGCG